MYIKKWMITFCFYLFYPASQVFWSWGRMNCSHNDIPYMTVKVIRAFSSHPANRTLGIMTLYATWFPPLFPSKSSQPLEVDTQQTYIWFIINCSNGWGVQLFFWCGRANFGRLITVMQMCYISCILPFWVVVAEWVKSLHLPLSLLPSHCLSTTVC